MATRTAYEHGRELPNAIVNLGRGRHLRAEVAGNTSTLEARRIAAPVVDIKYPETEPIVAVSRLTMRAIIEESDRRLEMLMTFSRLARESESRIQSRSSADQPADESKSRFELSTIPECPAPEHLVVDVRAPEADVKYLETSFIEADLSTDATRWNETNSIEASSLNDKFASNLTPEFQNADNQVELHLALVAPEITAVLAA